MPADARRARRPPRFRAAPRVQSYIDFYPLGHKRDFQRSYRAGLKDAINQIALLAQTETDERKKQLLQERRAQFQTVLNNNPVT